MGKNGKKYCKKKKIHSLISSNASLEGETSSDGCILHKIPPKVEQCNIGEIVVEGCFEMVFDVMYDNCCDIVVMNLLSV